VIGGRTLDIIGFELQYKTNDVVAVRVTLEGVAPAVTQTADKTIIRIVELDNQNRPVESSKVERTTKVINIQEIADMIAARDAELQTFRTHIDEKAVMDIDTSAADAKYNEAKQKVDSARALPSTQYVLASQYLTDAQKAIQNGETELDRAWAEKEVQTAQIPINNVDTIIAWFKGNTSTANDQQLPAIISQRESAVTLISLANDNIANGNYVQARTKAQEAYTKGNESYNNALARQKDLLSGWKITFPALPGITFIVIGIIVVVLVAVGIIIYRKRSRWDELG
jgi:hypothetical protein